MTASPRKTPEHQPWQVCRSDGNTITVIADEKYPNLAAAEKAASARAIKEIGVIFAPVKFGRLIKAAKEERIVIQ